MIKYWVKPVGTFDSNKNPTIKPGTVYDETSTIISFSNKKPSKVEIGDILITYVVGDGRIISYYKVITTANIANPSDYFWESWMERWPWYVNVQNQSPLIGKEWWKYNLVLKELKEVYIKSNPNSAISYKGGKTLGALSFGSDKLQIDNKFAEYLIDKINYPLNKQLSMFNI